MSPCILINVDRKYYAPDDAPINSSSSKVMFRGKTIFTVNVAASRTKTRKYRATRLPVMRYHTLAGSRSQYGNQYSNNHMSYSWTKLRYLNWIKEKILFGTV